MSLEFEKNSQYDIHNSLLRKMSRHKDFLPTLWDTQIKINNGTYAHFYYKPLPYLGEIIKKSKNLKISKISKYRS